MGSINLDLVARCERLPRPGETAQGTAFERIAGGKGANQAVAAARLGAEVRMIGRVGNDDFAEEALRSLVADGVALDVREVDASTGVALVIVDGQGDTQITVVPGANAALGPDDVDLPGEEAVLCQLEVPGVTVAAAARKAGGFFCLNAAPARPAPPEAVSRADLIVVNPFEYERLDKRRVRLVALTQGSDGAVLLRRGRVIARARPPRVETVDGTAAGDAFTACLAVSRRGAQPSLPTATEIDAMLRR